MGDGRGKGNDFVQKENLEMAAGVGQFRSRFFFPFFLFKHFYLFIKFIKKCI